MNRHLSLFAFLAIASTLSVAATDLSPQFPVRMPTEKGSWKITIEREDSPQPPPPKTGSAGALTMASIPAQIAKSITVDLDPPLRRDVIEFADGLKKELWRIGGLWFIETDQGIVALTIIGFGANYAEWHSFDANQFDWVTEKNGKGIVEFKGKQALLYETGEALAPLPTTVKGYLVTTGDGAPKKISEPMTRLWIDAESHLPLALKEGDRTYVFKFGKAAFDLLKVPERFLKESQRFETMSRVPPPFKR